MKNYFILILSFMIISCSSTLKTVSAVYAVGAVAYLFIGGDPYFEDLELHFNNQQGKQIEVLDNNYEIKISGAYDGFHGIGLLFNFKNTSDEDFVIGLADFEIDSNYYHLNEINIYKENQLRLSHDSEKLTSITISGNSKAKFVVKFEGKYKSKAEEPVTPIYVKAGFFDSKLILRVDSSYIYI